MISKMIPKSSQNRVGLSIGFALCFSLFLAPQMEPTTPENSNITYIKQRFPQIVPFPFDHRFGTNKSPKTTPKPFQISPKSIPKTHRKSTPNFTDFGLKMTPQMTPEMLQNRPGGHCGAIWDPKKLKREVQAPPGTPKWTSGDPLGHHFHHFWNLVWMFFNIIHDLLSTMPNYVRINIQRQKMKE